MSALNAVVNLAASMGCGVIASEGEIWIGREGLEITAGLWTDALTLLEAADERAKAETPEGRR
jgi:hypothetical protein